MVPGRGIRPLTNLVRMQCRNSTKLSKYGPALAEQDTVHDLARTQMGQRLCSHSTFFSTMLAAAKGQLLS